MEKDLENMSMDEFFKYLREKAKNDEYAFLLQKEKNNVQKDK